MDTNMIDRVAREVKWLNAVYGRGSVEKINIEIPKHGTATGTVECKLQYGTSKRKLTLTATCDKMTVRFCNHQTTLYKTVKKGATA